MNKELQKFEHSETALSKPIPAEALTIERAFEAVINNDLSAEKLDVLKQLVAMSAEQKFNAAFAAMQPELPVIVAKSVIPNRGKYEKLEDIMATIQPVLAKYQFSVSFENDFRENRIGETCILSHGGHSRRTTYWTRPRGRSDDEAQADSKTATTARRNALIRALNLVIRQDALIDEDNDPQQLGTQITPEQADELEHRVKMLCLPMKDWLELGGCKTSFREMTSAAYGVVDRALSMRERRGK